MDLEHHKGSAPRTGGQIAVVARTPTIRVRYPDMDHLGFYHLPIWRSAATRQACGLCGGLEEASGKQHSEEMDEAIHVLSVT